MAASLKDLILELKGNVEAKLNYLHTQLGNVVPWKGLSPDAGNSLTEDAEGKLLFKERTAAEIKTAYESNLDTNAFTDAYKATVDEFGNDLVNKADLDPATGKLLISQVPQFSITNKISAVETTLAAFITNVNNYTFDEGDVIVINNAGTLEHYLYDGQDRSLETSYSPVTPTSIGWANITGKPTNLATTEDLALKEDDLGNPDADGKILSSTISGVRSWITPPTGGATVEDQIVDGVVDKAPSQNIVFDALAGKANDLEVVKGVLDGSLYLDPTTQKIRSNVSTYDQKFTWLTGQSQIRTLDFEPTNFIAVFRNGVETEAYTFTSPTTFEYTGTLVNNDVVKIVYEHFIVQP